MRLPVELFIRIVNEVLALDEKLDDGALLQRWSCEDSSTRSLSMTCRALRRAIIRRALRIVKLGLPGSLHARSIKLLCESYGYDATLKLYVDIARPDSEIQHFLGLLQNMGKLECLFIDTRLCDIQTLVWMATALKAKGDVAPLKTLQILELGPWINDANGLDSELFHFASGDEVEELCHLRWTSALIGVLPFSSGMCRCVGLLYVLTLYVV
jgi:hypothetical protein